MTFLNRFGIGLRLRVAFALVILLTLVVATGAVLGIAKVNESSKDLATNWLPATRALGEYRDAINVVRRAEAQHLLSATPEEYAKEEKRIEATKGKAAHAWERYMATVTTDDERQLAKAIQDGQSQYYAAQPKLLDLSRAGEAQRAEAMAHFRGPSRAGLNATMEALDRDVAFQVKQGDVAYVASQEAFSLTRAAVIAIAFMAMGVSAVLAWVITNSIVRPIQLAVSVAETVTQGDLTSKIRTDGHDEPAKLLKALHRMNDSLVAIVSQVRNSSDSIATGSAQIASGNLDLSQRTEEQASNLQQTAASMEELTSTVKQNADTATQAQRLAERAATAANAGGEVVGRVVATMEDISSSSRKIADIIGVIDGIAFQTNILALNAAVEAARAGEQGRGFAVVAGEVRSLAQRSAQAAKEIKSLIGESVQRVEAGASLVNEAGRSIRDIVDQVEQVSTLIGEISTASTEQSMGISQVGDAVNQLDQVTQQNAALVEEGASAAESLKHQAAQLALCVSVFKVA